ncbi:MAG: protease complex subunit PrcB family protein [Lachnospiraceae bacterium]|nr:protease complex subunit PrcB family protein [Lachnospiraceae bacterium]
MKQFMLILCCISVLVLLGGCMEKGKKQNRKQVDFTVCTESQVPSEVKKMIEEKKHTPFQFTYNLQEYMYIVIGYGEQNGGGYSIKIVECSEDKVNMYVDTTLLGSEESVDSDLKSYPYIVIKCIKPKKNVIFL